MDAYLLSFVLAALSVAALGTLGAILFALWDIRTELRIMNSRKHD